MYLSLNQGCLIIPVYALRLEINHYVKWREKADIDNDKAWS
jgi:hypothetical protein